MVETSSGPRANQYWSRSEAVLVTICNHYWSEHEPLLVAPPPPFVEHKESPPQARMSELAGGLAIRLGNYFFSGRTLVTIPADVCAL